MTQEHDREILCAANKLALAFRALRLVQKDLRDIMDFEKWDGHLEAFKKGEGEDPQVIRRVRIKQTDVVTNEFWEAVNELEKVIR